jgi:hypothetical protein
MIEAITALAGVWLAVITTWTLVVLRRYAADTKTIAKTSVEQVENAQMPFVAIVMGDSTHVPWAMRNQGSGTAVNIYFSRPLNANEVMMQWMTPLAPREEIPLDHKSGDLLTTKNGFIVEYESLSGKKYRTTTTRFENKMKVNFEKIL